ncbi:MFS transporter [Mucilaginibacter robiniae]|uniref:Lysosomal dipeptide transporter MFSD1 n=1 Tax=Mucilaginibacter robiniae TaxID=2728022 RepID=A0A7L5E782_9SPHI|nr:MFS transporter [Mucilaginibacter robiniae]QJD96713.1 MFS transporter [Mucilaginibacter robiniae]
MADSINEASMQSYQRPFIIAWAFGCMFYFLEYAARSSPAVMIPQLSDTFKITAVGVSAVLGMYYYTYSATSLIAGVALDHAGARYPITIGIGILCIGCLLFAVPSVVAGNTGRLLQGAGSAFAFTGCVYLASHGFPAKYIATAIGFTQCVGMLGGSAGQFVVGPLVHNGVSIQAIWIAIGVLCALVCLGLFIITPREKLNNEGGSPWANIIEPYKVVFANPQSYLSGIISGLLFAPTTIFAMTWGIAFFQQDKQFNYNSAVLTCAMVPLGWVVGCPLLGWISDRIKARKPAIIGGGLLMMLSFAQLLYLPSLLPAFVSMLIFGIASGAAMIPYSIIKEANPDNVKGSATGAINFLTFGVTALLGPVFAKSYGKDLTTTTDHLAHFKASGNFWLIITALAIVVGFIIKETGGHARAAEKLS